MQHPEQIILVFYLVSWNYILILKHSKPFICHIPNNISMFKNSSSVVLVLVVFTTIVFLIFFLNENRCQPLVWRNGNRLLLNTFFGIAWFCPYCMLPLIYNKRVLLLKEIVGTSHDNIQRSYSYFTTSPPYPCTAVIPKRNLNYNLNTTELHSIFMESLSTLFKWTQCIKTYLSQK